MRFGKPVVDNGPAQHNNGYRIRAGVLLTGLGLVLGACQVDSDAAATTATDPAPVGLATLEVQNDTSVDHDPTSERIRFLRAAETSNAADLAAADQAAQDAAQAAQAAADQAAANKAAQDAAQAAQAAADEAAQAAQAAADQAAADEAARQAAAQLAATKAIEHTTPSAIKPPSADQAARDEAARQAAADQAARDEAARQAAAAPATGLNGPHANLESQFLTMINATRAQYGAAPLVADQSLLGPARTQAATMAQSGVLAHQDLQAVLVASPFRTIGENVGYGPSVQVVHDALLASPGHFANLSNVAFTHVGIAVYFDAAGTLWTAHVFGG